MKKYLLISISVFVFNLLFGQSIKSDNSNPSNIYRDSRSLVFYDDFSDTTNWIMTNTGTTFLNWQITDSVFLSNPNTNMPFMNSESLGGFAKIFTLGMPTSTAVNADMTLASPLDCSSSAKVMVEFQTLFFKGNDSHTLFVSTDGSTWNPFALHTSYDPSYPSRNSERTYVDISSIAANQPQVWIRFNFTGGTWHYWMIDDLKVITTGCDDVALMDPAMYALLTYNGNVCGPLDYSIVPKNQIQPMVIRSTFYNRGSCPANNCHLNVKIYDSQNNLDYNINSPNFILNPDTIVFDSVTWVPPALLENYTILVKVVYDNSPIDANPWDDTDTLKFSVVNENGLYARDKGKYSDYGFSNTNNAYIMAEVYNLVDTIQIYGYDIAFGHNTIPGAVICLQMFELDTFNGILNMEDNCLNGIYYTIQPSDISSNGNLVWTTIPITFIGTGGKLHLIALNNDGFDRVEIMDAGQTPNYTFSTFIYDPTATTGGPWFYSDRKPMMRINCNLNLGLEEKNKAQEISIYPNPATDESNLNFTLQNNAEVSFSIIDLTGKEILYQNLGMKNAGEHSHRINLINVAEGIYFCQLTANGIQQTIKLQVIR